MYGYSVVYEGILSCKCFIVQLIILNNQLNLIPVLLWFGIFPLSVTHLMQRIDYISLFTSSLCILGIETSFETD